MSDEPSCTDLHDIKRVVMVWDIAVLQSNDASTLYKKTKIGNFLERSTFDQ